MKRYFKRALELTLNKIVAEAERYPDIIPYYPTEGKYRDLMMPNGILWWTNGFWPGLLWLAYEKTGNGAVRTAAKNATQRLYAAVNEQPDALDHDVGFMYLLSAVKCHEICGNRQAKNVALAAADLLLGRLTPKGFIRAWNSCPYTSDVDNVTIVDCLMNLPLLVWASNETGDPRYALAAKRHADTCLSHILRADGSSRHLVHFISEEHSEELVGQGYGVDTAWSRGQGWAICGYASLHIGTGETRYIEAAEKAARYVISKLKKCGYLPPVDYCQPASVHRVDTSAGAITASGLLDLYRLTGNRVYKSAAEKILHVLTKRYADFGVDNDGILNGGTVMYHGDAPENVRLIYGDYYYLEALLKLQKNSKSAENVLK